MSTYYGFDSSTESEGSNFNPAPSGVNEGWVLEEIQYIEGQGSSSNSIQFTFKHPEKGWKYNHREWQPDESNENFERKVKSMNKRLKHIATKYVGSDAEITGVKTYEEYVNRYIAMIKQSDHSYEVALLLEYKNETFVGFPNYVPFIAVSEEEIDNLKKKYENGTGYEKEPIKTDKSDVSDYGSTGGSEDSVVY